MFVDDCCKQGSEDQLCCEDPKEEDTVCSSNCIKLAISSEEAAKRDVKKKEFDKRRRRIRDSFSMVRRYRTPQEGKEGCKWKRSVLDHRLKPCAFELFWVVTDISSCLYKVEV